MIQTTIEKKFGQIPSRLVPAPDIERTLVVTLRKVGELPDSDPDPGGTGGGIGFGGGSGGGAPNPDPPDTWWVSVGVFAPPTLGGAAPAEELEDAMAGVFLGGNVIYFVSGAIFRSDGVEEIPPRGGRVLLAPGLDGTTASIQLDPVTGLMRRVPAVQTNEPGWDGHAISLEEVEPDSTVTYAFDPLSDIPFFTGLTEVEDSTFLRPSDYFAAFEVFGSQAVVWYQGNAVLGPFEWSEGDRFALVRVDGTTRFFVNTDPIWSS